MFNKKKTIMIVQSKRGATNTIPCSHKCENVFFFILFYLNHVEILETIILSMVKTRFTDFG